MRPTPNIVVPMAGLGSRFTEAGYRDPKPLIEFLGKRMIEHVVDSIPFEAHWIFIVQQQHIDEYQVDEFLKTLRPGCDVIALNGLSEGAAVSVLAAKHLINNMAPLGVLNSDNIIDWTPLDPLMEGDGMILCFEDTDPKWSFAKLDSDGWVSEVQEKNPISTHATAGFYMWAHGRDFVQDAQMMIDRNIRTNNEFYLAPVFNQSIQRGLYIEIQRVKAMYGVGTPGDLEAYVRARV